MHCTSELIQASRTHSHTTWLLINGGETCGTQSDHKNESEMRNYDRSRSTFLACLSLIAFLFVLNPHEISTPHEIKMKFTRTFGAISAVTGHVDELEFSDENLYSLALS